MNLNVIRAIFKRNFVSYFSNPTGYLFICGFVLLIAFASFWPNEFFNSNLANLNQLNRYLPFIMLVFIPAITMSIWAEERRQGTDELLLTIPAADVDVVIGKYLAAVAIFSVALLFSALANWLVFISRLGVPDFGLYVGSYFGYWMVGLAMLAVGMVASFLTGNLTVGYILGAAFNAPLAFASSADVIVTSNKLAQNVQAWSLAEKFRDFGQGVITLTGLGYFLLIVAVMLYFSMVLIGRRHWLGGRDGPSMVGHYAVRAIALVLLAVGLNLLLVRFQSLNRVRLDITSARLSALAGDSKKLIAGLDTTRPVQIDAYVSPQVPEGYVETRLNLVNVLREVDALGGDKVRVRIHDTEQFSDDAATAETQYGIRGQQVLSRNRGSINAEQIFMGIAVTCGLDKVVVPFIDRGVPVEYEVIRSIATVAQQKRKTVGVLVTDARLMGGFDPSTMGATESQLLITELEKQYDVKEVRPDGPITEKFDVLLAVQPSSLAPEQMQHFLNAVRSGQPTAIFEDPLPVRFAVAGTTAPKQPAGGNPFMQQQPQPKGDITPLWNMLGVDFRGSEVVWQDYNPYPANDTWEQEFVFVGEGSGAGEPFSPKSAISNGLRQMLFLFPGAIRRHEAADLKFTPLVYTGDKTGTVPTSSVLQMSMFGQGGGLNPQRHYDYVPTRDEYVLACHIQGPVKEDPLASAAGDEKPAEKADKKELNVVLVADIDVLDSVFFFLRARGEEAGSDMNFNFDNVIFVLNSLDMLAGDTGFISVRRHRPSHKTLTVFETSVADLRNRVIEAREEFQKEFEKQQAAEQSKLDEEVEKLRAQKGIDTGELLRRVAIAQEQGQRRLQAKTERLERDRDRKIDEIERETARELRKRQNDVKFAAVLLPPILPLLMGVIVFFNRRAREREGVSKSRLR